MAEHCVLVLGFGMHGRVAIEDLEQSTDITHIIAADKETSTISRCLASIGARKTSVRQIDAHDTGQLQSLMGEGASVVISLLPPAFDPTVARLAIETGSHLVTANYGHDLRDLDKPAAERSITIMPESGFDPGIDLVIARRLVDEFDEVDTLNSYGTGLPAPECKNANVINYKISWSFIGALRVYRRPARFLQDGQEEVVPGEDILRRPWVHTVEVGRLGRFEAFPNGDVVPILEALGIRHSVKESARYTLRWPGSCEFWSKISALGLLDDVPVPGTAMSPREFLDRHLAPRLQYGPSERDMAILRVDAAGTRNGRRMGRRFELIGYRDLATGVLAMNRLVGYPVSIVAQMILAGTITRRGVGSPARDIPPAPFFESLAARNIDITEQDIDPAECCVRHDAGEQDGPPPRPATR